MPIKYLKYSVIYLCLYLLSGCSSSIKYTERMKKEREYTSGIYLATRTDAKIIENAFDDSSSNWGQGVAIILAPFALIDIPFSLVFDSITLPYDVYANNGFESTKSKNKKLYNNAIGDKKIISEIVQKIHMKKKIESWERGALWQACWYKGYINQKYVITLVDYFGEDESVIAGIMENQNLAKSDYLYIFQKHRENGMRILWDMAENENTPTEILLIMSEWKDRESIYNRATANLNNREKIIKSF